MFEAGNVRRKHDKMVSDAPVLSVVSTLFALDSLLILRRRGVSRPRLGKLSLDPLRVSADPAGGRVIGLIQSD